MISSVLIREARLRAGLSQAELGARAGKAASMVSRWERGAASPPLATVVALVRAAGFDLTVGITPADPHDLALIRRTLALPPARRLARAVTAANALGGMAATARTHRHG